MHRDSNFYLLQQYHSCCGIGAEEGVVWFDLLFCRFYLYVFSRGRLVLGGSGCFESLSRGAQQESDRLQTDSIGSVGRVHNGWCIVSMAWEISSSRRSWMSNESALEAASESQGALQTFTARTKVEIIWCWSGFAIRYDLLRVSNPG